MAYAIAKYNLFDIEAVTEGGLETDLKLMKLEEGASYLFLGPEKETPFSAFRGRVIDTPGLVITTEHPRKIREKFYLAKTPILWLTNVSTDEKVLDPSRLDFEVIYTISSFMHENESTVVLLDGIN